MKISVCITTYNGEKYLKEQLDSIICQLKENDEIIISDDGSSDGTIEIINQFNDSRIKLIHNSNLSNFDNINKSYIVTKNFENGLKNCSGDIIFLSDQDDIWHLEKVKECLNIFTNTEFDLILHDAVIVDVDNHVLFNSYFNKIGSRKGIIRNVYKNSYLGSCMVFRRKILNISIPFPQNLIAHDIWIGLIAEIFGKVVFFKKPLLRYRRHDFNVTQSAEKSSNDFFFKIFYRIQLLKDLILKICIKW